MKNSVFILLCVFFSFSINGQLYLTENNIINTNNDFYQCNRIISMCGIGMDYQKANDELNRIKNKKHHNYILGKGLLLYNVSGRNEAIKFIKKQNLNADAVIYYNALLSLITENIDDYYWYKMNLNNSLYSLKLSIREAYFKNVNDETKKKLAYKIQDFLENEMVIDKNDKKFLTFAKLDFKYSYFETEQKNLEIKRIYEETPLHFNTTYLKAYLESYFDITSFDLINSIEKLKEVYSLLKSPMTLNKEEELLDLLKDIKDDKEKIRFAAYVFYCSKENILPFQDTNPDTIHRALSFSEGLKKYLLNMTSKDQILSLIIKEEKSLNLKLPITFNELKNKNKNQCFTTLGYYTFFRILKHMSTKNSLVNNGETDISMYLGNYKNDSSWKKIIENLKENPLGDIGDIRNLSYPKINNIEKYKYVTKTLKEFNLYNYNQKTYLLFIIINQKNIFEIENQLATEIINILIDLYSLNQKIGNPGNYDTYRGILSKYFVDEKALGKIKSQNKKVLEIILEKIDKENIYLIYEKMHHKLNEHPRNLNLINLYIMLFKNSNSIARHFSETNLNSENSSLTKIRINDYFLKNYLLHLYKKETHKENLLFMGHLFNYAGMKEKGYQMLKFKKKYTSSIFD